MRITPYVAALFALASIVYLRHLQYILPVLLATFVFGWRFRPEDLRKKSLVEKFVLLLLIFRIVESIFLPQDSLYTTLLLCSFLLFAPRYAQNWIFGSLFFVYIGVLPLFTHGWSLFAGTLLDVMFIFGQMGFSLLIVFALLMKHLPENTETILFIALLFGYLLLEANVLTLQNAASGIMQSFLFYGILLWSHKHFR